MRIEILNMLQNAGPGCGALEYPVYRTHMYVGKRKKYVNHDVVKRERNLFLFRHLVCVYLQHFDWLC